MVINLVPVTPKHYEFVRALRTDPRTQGAFLEQENITAPQQTRYMDRYSKNYYICLLHGDPCGYVGVINDDIRICSHPDYQRKGVGYFMLSEIKKIYPSAVGRIKENNLTSQKLFEKCGVEYTLI